MPGATAQPISALLPAVLRRVEQQHGALFVARREWRRIVGGRLAAHAKPVGLRGGRLVVAVEGPGEGFLLDYQRPVLLERLKAATKGKVQEIVIRPGRPKEESSRGDAVRR
ncbi:MAG: DUF721 domain-containing protein [Candidatus Omnitrophica bacterium]|nr:DUF721 domain-containing protein [Candidatus Omnitrophota bacterium]MBI3021096.1 DUF721 domain-containing protein [Candidatus Omnitrophota bacterium]